MHQSVQTIFFIISLINQGAGSCWVGFSLRFLLHSGFGHDKSQAILPYRKLSEPPTLFFFGDGVSGTFFPHFALGLG